MRRTPLSRSWVWERSRALVEELTGQAEQALSGFAEPDFLLCLARRWRGRKS